MINKTRYTCKICRRKRYVEYMERRTEKIKAFGQDLDISYWVCKLHNQKTKGNGRR